METYCTTSDVKSTGDVPLTAPCADLTADALPEAKEPIQAQCSDTGVSSDYVPDEAKQWFVLRATYGRSEKALKEIEDKKIKTYVPLRNVWKKKNGVKLRRVQEPLLPNLIFAFMTREQSKSLLKFPAPTALYLKYYLDRTKPVEYATGLNPPLIVPNSQMENFIRLTSIDNEFIQVLPKDYIKFKSGDLVRVKDGDFAGVVGKVVRAAGQQCVAVEIEGLCIVVTAYIPSAFVEKITSE